MAEALVRHDELIADHVEAHGGRFLKSMGEGDSTVSVFDSAPAALDGGRRRHARARGRDAGRATCASPCASRCTPARPSAAAPTTSARRVNLAARVRGQADGGQIFLSAVTARARRRAPPGRLRARRPRPATGCTGVSAPERIHALRGPGSDARRCPVGECPYRGLLAFEPARPRVLLRARGRRRRPRRPAARRPAARGRRRVGQRQVVGPARRRRRRGRSRARSTAIDRATIVTPGADPQLDVADDPRELVVVDQFEELYTLCDDRERRERFIDALLALDVARSRSRCAPTSTGS